MMLEITRPKIDRVDSADKKRLRLQSERLMHKLGNLSELFQETKLGFVYVLFSAPPYTAECEFLYKGTGEC